MRCALLFCSSLLLVATAWGQQFELVEPSGLVGATVQVEPGRLLVHERTGQRLFFSREQRYDSPDGLFLGYFNFELNRVLRFPRSGQGKMQVADLDDVTAQFRYTRRVARRSVAANLQPPAGIQPLAISPPHGFPYPGMGYPGDGLPVFENHRGLFPSSPYSQPYVSGYRYPQSVLIDSKVIPNSPLSPARMQLFNGGRREIQVGVVDLNDPQATRSMRIPPQTAVEIDVERDPGGQQVETYRTITALGETIRKQIVRPIPPVIRYEIVVHEWSMQSIAIDRTGKSPQAIEDVNFQGRGLGRFPLPPGEQLQAGTIDVYRTAIDRGNQGTVAPILANEKSNADAASPLERAMLESQRAAQRGR